jgi:YesN/AraC family two-component response regulator
LNSVLKNGHTQTDVKKNEILIVEDNTQMLNFLIEIFSEKYEVRVAQNGLDAVKQMEEKLPDLMISDIMMPEMDGAELCRRVKSTILTSHIPVILLTAKTGTENIIKGYELGADVYIEKPFNPSSLLLQVQNLLRTRDYNRQQFKESATMNIGVIARNKYDEKLLNDIRKVVEDNISNEEFSVSDVIKTVGISRTMLHVKLKSMLDMSIGDYIRNIRIERAKVLLLQGDTIADTAYETGFSDPNYFSKCFKKQTGKTPSEFVKDSR